MKYLPDLLSGRKLGAFGLTEPGAGTDASGQQTTAVLEGDHYVLNGVKCFITNATEAETFVVFAMTDKSKGNHGISAFIVEKDFPGFSIGKHEKKMGLPGKWPLKISHSGRMESFASMRCMGSSATTSSMSSIGSR